MQVKKVLREFHIKPRKRLGQNFLFSSYHLEKIIKAVALDKHDVVVEIGSGIGNLTELLLEKAKKVISIEKDRKLVEVQRQIFASNKNLKLINEDFLKIDLRKIFKSEQKFLKIVTNPPYYISTQIIEKLIDYGNCYKEAFLSLQKEYVQRMTASSGTKNYGRLTIFTQVYLDIDILFKIPKSVFYPAPRVDSVFIAVRPKEKTGLKNKKKLELISREFFSSKRKKISTILKNSLVLSDARIDKVLSSLNIDSNSRPEELSVSDYVNIANLLN